MDSIIIELQNGQVPTSSCIQILFNLVKYQEVSGCIDWGQNSKASLSMALKSWKVLVLLVKCVSFTETTVTLADICAAIIEKKESSLNLKQLDLEKLLLSLFSKSGHVQNGIFLARRVYNRLCKQSGLEPSESIAQICPISIPSNVEPDLLSLWIIFWIHYLKFANDLEKREALQEHLEKLFQLQYCLSPSHYFKSLTSLSQCDHAFALSVVLSSDVCIKSAVKVLSSHSNAKQKTTVSLANTQRAVIICSAIDMEIQSYGGSKNDAAWMIFNGKIPSTIDENTLDNFSILALLRRFRRHRSSLEVEEFISLTNVIGVSCDGDDACKLCRWCLSFIPASSINLLASNRIIDIARNHRKCSHRSIFILCAELIKMNKFDPNTVTLLKSCILDDYNQEDCELEAQKYEYLAVALHSSDLLSESIISQAKCISVSMSSEIQVLNHTPKSESCMRLIRRTERWLRYLSVADDSFVFTDDHFPKNLGPTIISSVLCPLLCKAKLTTTVKSKIVSVIVKLSTNPYELLKALYVDYRSLEIEQVRVLETVLPTDNCSVKIWLIALKHLVGILDIKELEMDLVESSFLEDDDLELKSLLSAIYFIDRLPDMPIRSPAGPIDISNVSHLLYASWRFLCRSIELKQKMLILEAIEFALESQRLFDLLLRCVSSSNKPLDAKEKLAIDGISTHLFSHLSIVYGQRPFVKEARYYLKQASSGRLCEINMQNGAGRLDDGQSILSSNAVVPLLQNDFSALLTFTATKNLVSGLFVNTPSENDSLTTQYHNLYPLLDNDMTAGLRLCHDSLDMFGVLCIKMNKTEEFCRFIEYNKCILSLNLQFSSLIDVDRAPAVRSRNAFNQYFKTLKRNRTISITYLRNNNLSVDVIWIIFYGESDRLFRLSLPAGRFESWTNELSSIETSNKSLLKRKPDMTVEEKRQWWEMRISLDKQMSSLIQNIKKFLETFINIHAPSTESNQFMTIDKYHINMSLISSRYSEELVSMVSSSLQLCDLNLKNTSISEAIRKLNVADELDNVFISTPITSLKVPVRHLLVSSELQSFPWESILGVACVRYIPILLADPSNVSIETENQHNVVSYVINPSGDLIETERRFTPIVTSSADFSGVIGRPPLEHELIEFLTSSRLYLYCGHGGGDAYLGHGKITKLSKIAPSLLIGCSSGKMRCMGTADPEGNPIAYCKANAPFIVCNLWDVTDKDIDAFTIKLLNRLVSENEHSLDDVASMVMSSRDECSLKFINGAAPVLYSPIIVNKLD